MIESDHKETHPTEAEIDETLKESFPASDPPAWTLGIEQHERKKEDASDPKESKESKARSNNPAG